MLQFKLPHLCPPSLAQLLLGTPVCCPLPTQPGHPTGRPYLSKMFCRKPDTAWASHRTSVLVQNVLSQAQPFRTSTSGQLILWLDCWFLLRAPCYRIPWMTYTQIQELQLPSIVAFKTPQTTCFHCSCWRQQQELIGVVKLTYEKSSHPPHVQFGSILWVVSPQAHFSQWHNFSSAVLAQDRTIRRSPSSFHLQMIHNPCTMSNHPADQHVIRSNFCLVFHWDGFAKCSKLSLDHHICSLSSLIITWWCHWWRRRAWGRCRMMTLLSWRCHWGWRMRTGGRTRWQAWNHDRNKVLRVALYPNTVFLMRCGFWQLIHS